jgi:hypothetical protein
MTISAQIRAALETALVAVPGIPAGRAYDGVPYRPVRDVPWVRARVQWLSQRQIVIGAPQYLHEGLFLVDVFTPNGKGATAAIGDRITAAFTPFVPLVSGDVSVRIRFAQKGPILEEPDWLTLPVTIAHYTYATSP